MQVTIDYVAHMMEKCLKWIEGCDAYVNAQIKFVTIQQQRTCNVALYDAGLLTNHFVAVIDDMHTPSATQTAWFHNPNIQPCVLTWCRLHAHETDFGFRSFFETKNGLRRPLAKQASSAQEHTPERRTALL
jgi:hypothetical protein